jgi:peptidylglycine monooxygenase
MTISRVLMLVLLVGASVKAEVAYEFAPDFLSTPPGKETIGNGHGEIAVDSTGKFYVSVQEEGKGVQVYGADGKFIKALPLPGSLHGFVVRKDEGGEFLFGAVLGQQKVIKTTLDGEVVMEIPTSAFPEGKAGPKGLKLTNCDVAPNGDIYVVDGYGSNYVLRYDRNGKFLSRFGGKEGVPEGERLNNAHGIAIDTRQGANQATVIATSRADKCFRRFTLEGKYLETIEVPGAMICRPVISGQELYAGVCWSSTPEINKLPQNPSGFTVVLNAENKVISAPGGTEPVYENGQLKPLMQAERVFDHGHDVCVLENGDLIVCQWNAFQTYPIKLERV